MSSTPPLGLAPARHFSGRKLSNRFSTLWSSWVVRSPGWSLYFDGDSGHGAHFAEIGNRYGPFDIALVENGAYNQNWSQIHMHPEQAARAGTELRAQVVMPVHWAKFDLAYHTPAALRFVQWRSSKAWCMRSWSSRCAERLGRDASTG